jgi:hypothetical protein
MAWLVIVGVTVSSAPAAAATTGVGNARSLSAAIARGLQGTQLDVWGGGVPSPGRATTMFVHRGDRAVELYWTTDGWCLARILRWTVEDVHSASSFAIRYVAVRQYPDCLMVSGAEEVLRVVDIDVDDAGRPALTGWWAANDTWTVRTTCSDRWNDPAPCGFTDAFALVPPM